MTKILIVGQGLFCEGLALLLSDDSAVEIIGEVGNCEDAQRIARRERPDVILIDHVQVLANQSAFNSLLQSVDKLRVISLTLSDNKMTIHNWQQIVDVTLPVLKKALHFQDPAIHVGECCG